MVLTSMNLDDCPICLMSINNGLITSCGHNFHINCLQQWYNIGNNTCPICREIQPVNNRNAPILRLTEPSRPPPLGRRFTYTQYTQRIYNINNIRSIFIRNNDRSYTIIRSN